MHIELKNIPVQNPKPDCRQFIDILMGRDNSRVPLVEYIVDEFVMKQIVTEILGREWADYGKTRESQKAYLNNFIEFWHRMGYDFVRFEAELGFLSNKISIQDTAEGVTGTRFWADEHSGRISSWEDFEKFPWPRVEDFDFFPFEYINRNLPDGMGLMSCHGGGIFEHLSWIMSLEGLCLTIHDDPELVKAVTGKIFSLIKDFYNNLLDLDNLIAVFQGDDMGFKTGTLISPEDLKKYILPCHKHLSEMSKEKGLPYFLHSCGNLEEIMEDLIEDVKIEGKHSFEDVIMPVEKFQAKFGNRIAVLGGLDINILSASTLKAVRKKTRQLIDYCGRAGRYAVGSGNSIPSYIPVEFYLTMVDEALNVI
ncbi:uroporphyrinogen decarboxylase family protein [candidate division KSB1 bacterium]